MTKNRSGNVAPDSPQWREYLRWNEWIAEAFYPESRAEPVPTYLDFEGAPAARLASLSGHASTDETATAVVEVVKSTLPELGKKLFEQHERALRAWALATKRELKDDAQTSIAPPPVLPLLLSFVLAAEQMRGDSEMGASNYYGRLGRVLQRDIADLRPSYQGSAERIWGALNAWLVEVDGRRGLPSAYSISTYRYVGIAVSQALVREADRSHLPDFFEFADLAPNSDVPPEALEPLLRAWTAAPNGGATQQLRRLIENDPSRARVAEVASVELAAWHGNDGRAPASTRPQLRRPVTLRLQFGGVPLRQPRFTPILRVRADTPGLEARLLAEGGASIDLTLERLSPGAYAPPRSTVPRAADLLQSRLRYVVAGQTVERAPTPGIVFRSDEFGVEFWETTTVVRGERLNVLVRSEFATDFEQVLREVSPTSWRRGKYSELPKGWVLFEGVEVLRPPSQTASGKTKWLADLVTPVTSQHLSLHDGFRMPGTVRQRWLTSAPPVVTASSDGAGGFRVTIDRIPDMLDSIDSGTARSSRTTVFEGRGASTEPLIIALQATALEAGTYEVVLRDGGKSTGVRQRRQFTLTSPVPRNTADGVVGLDLDNPLAAIERVGARTATTFTESDAYLIGAANFGDGVTDREVRTSARSRTWTAAPARRDVARPSLETAAPGSCFYTRAHHLQLETPPVDSRGRVAAEWSAGTCKRCGITKLFQNHAWKVARKEASSRTPHYKPIPAPKLDDPEYDARLSLAIQALAVVGAGDGTSLRRVLAQVDSSALGVHRIVHDLAGIGTLAVARDEVTGEVTSWSLAPATIVSTSSGTVLTSFWSADSIAAVEEAALTEGCSIERASEGLASTLVGTDLDEDALWALAEGLDHDVFHAGLASREIAFALRPFGEAIGAVPRRPMRHGGDYERFDPRTASWEPVATPSVAGAYRSGTYAREYFVRTAADVDAGSRAIVDAATAKHAAALIAAAPPLLYHDREAGSLRTPLGCPLPGLFGRAAALAAVRVPYRHRDEFVYDGVADDVADRLTYLLSH